MPRKASWALLIWTVIMGIWAIGGGSQNCGGKVGSDLTYCQAGTGIGITLIIGLWLMGFIVLSLIWMMSRPHKRLCPQCGRDVKKGISSCKKCGYSFLQQTAGLDRAKY